MEAGLASNKADISVILPFIGGESEYVLRQAQAILAVGGESILELLMVDNNPRPLFEPGGRRGRIRFVHQPRQGSYAARNGGLAEAGGEFIAFIDLDCRPLPGWPAQAVALLKKDDRLGFVGGAILQTERIPGRPNLWERFDRHFHMLQKHYVENLRFAATANMTATRRCIERIGGFDARFMSGGDREWAERASAGGYSAAYAADSPVAHRCRDNFKGLLIKHLRLAGQTFVRFRVKGGNFSDMIGEENHCFRCRLSRTKQAEPRDQAAFIGILILLQLCRYAEVLRLNLGGSPVRG